MKIAFCITLLLFSLNAQAAWYQVEIIIFENLYPQADGEVWQGSRKLPDMPDTVSLVTEDTGGTGPVPFKQLHPGQYKLGGVYKELRFSKNYRPLLHLSWQQPGASGRNARAVSIQHVLDPESTDVLSQQVKLDGMIRLRVTRFLHMDIDLLYLLERLQAAELESSEAANDSTMPRASYTRLRESRRMKLNELHYFDHPLFGMIARVSRLKQE